MSSKYIYRSSLPPKLVMDDL